MIPIVNKGGEIPFDLKHIRFLIYEKDKKGLKELEIKLMEKLTGLLG